MKKILYKERNKEWKNTSLEMNRDRMKDILHRKKATAKGKMKNKGKPRDSMTALICNHFAQVSLTIYGFFTAMAKAK